MKKTLALCLLAFGCGGKSSKLPDGGDPRDVSGNYTITYDNKYTLKFVTAAGEKEVTQTGTGVANFGTYQGQAVTVDLAAFCAKPEIKCPTESFWAKTAITQPNLEANSFNLQELRVIDDTVHVPDAGVKARSLTGLVDHGNQDKFLLGLGASSASNANCIAVDVSLAGGRFSRVGEKTVTTMEYRTADNKPCDPDAGVPDAGAKDAGSSSDAGPTDAGVSDGGVPGPTCTLRPVTRTTAPVGAAVDGIKEGKVALWWAGGCAFGPIGVGATFILETGYTAKRTGEFDPPPFTPAPVSIPDGGLDPDGGVP